MKISKIGEKSFLTIESIKDFKKFEDKGFEILGYHNWNEKSVRIQFVRLKGDEQSETAIAYCHKDLIEEYFYRLHAQLKKDMIRICKKPIFVIAGNKTEFDKFIKEFNISKNESCYVTNKLMIEGIKNCSIVLIGAWYKKEVDFRYLKMISDVSNVDILNNF